MSLREIMLALEGCAQRRRFEHNSFAWLAHTTAKLMAYAPKKSSDFPALDRLQMHDKKPPAKPKDWKTVLAKVTAWVNGANSR